jgi:hypothetical protein
VSQWRKGYWRAKGALYYISMPLFDAPEVQARLVSPRRQAAPAAECGLPERGGFAKPLFSIFLLDAPMILVRVLPY